MPSLILLFETGWKPLAIVLAILATFYAGYHVRGSFDQVAADKLLQAQIEASKQAQDELNAKSAKVEADLAAERVKSSELTKRWSKINVQKHNVCVLSADVIGLLKDASSGQASHPR